jgi:DNA invertase Pin-like site-specific DNA recombinase
MTAEQKVTPAHLKRAAYLYVRQSTLRQVLENTESTKRQYALRKRAAELGWPEENIVTIDCDLGQSGASASGREGFQHLVADVGLGKAGIVLGLEVSRLARNCADWHRLLEICALTGTLILDEDGLYEPGHYNDRLLLGLKGTMSEAELHVLRARLRGGILSKAQRGELKMPLPTGLVYDELDRVCLDPDRQVQESLRHFFATFARVGSAWATVRAFRAEGLKFPKRGQGGSGEAVWQQLTHAIALDTLHNPRYAGAFCFGRTRSSKDIDGKVSVRQLPREQWGFLKKDAHPGYITWGEFLENEQRLLQNHQAHGGGESKAGAPREGPALLQGLVVCGKCGRAMGLRYHKRGERLIPDYECNKDCVESGAAPCQRIPGGGIDEAVGRLLVESVTPLALEVTFQVQDELQGRLDEAQRLRSLQVRRAQYESEQARLRFMRVDPNNRLVADTLEREWNEKLRLLAQAKEDCESQSQADAIRLGDEQRAKILALADDFPKLWNDPKTLDRDRKRMARLLLEDVTLQRGADIHVQVRFKGGAKRELRLPLPKLVGEIKKTKPQIVEEITILSEQHTDGEIARLLNERGWCSSGGCAFTLRIVNRLRRNYHIRSLGSRLKTEGWLTVRKIANLLECDSTCVNYWRKAGLLVGRRFSERRDYLYQCPPASIISQIKNRLRSTPENPVNPQQIQQGAV